MKWLLLISTVLAAACNNTETPKAAALDDTVNYTQPADVQSPEPPKTIADEFKIIGDSVVLPAFEITVQLSAAAEKKLRDKKETIVVSTILSGVPKDTTMKEYQQWGKFALGHAEVEIPAPGTTRFTNAKILKSDFGLLGSKDIKVLINVYSGRRTDPNNLLDCEIVEKPISELRLRKNVLNGKLIGEQ